MVLLHTFIEYCIAYKKMNLITDMSMKIWSKDSADITPGPVLAAKRKQITQIRQGGNIDWP